MRRVVLTNSAIHDDYDFRIVKLEWRLVFTVLYVIRSDYDPGSVNLEQLFGNQNRERWIMRMTVTLSDSDSGRNT